MSDYHKLLLRQIRRKHGDIEHIPPELLPLLETISKTYDQYDRDRNLLERSMDISSKELSEANEQLSQNTRALESSNQDLKRFAVVVAHDLKEPLRTITSFVQLIQKKEAANFSTESQEYCNFVVEGANRMAQLLDGLMKYSVINNPSEDEFKKISTQEVINNVRNNLYLKFKNNQADIISKNELPAIKGNPSQILQLFQNLIDNSLKFKGHAPPSIAIDAVPFNHQYHKFTIRDNGIGIKEEFKDKIFLIFKRLHHGGTSYEGTGVGLAVCKKIVEHHNGKIWVNTDYTDGFSLSFTLPKAF